MSLERTDDDPNVHEDPANLTGGQRVDGIVRMYQDSRLILANLILQPDQSYSLAYASFVRWFQYCCAPEIDLWKRTENEEFEKGSNFLTQLNWALFEVFVTAGLCISKSLLRNFGKLIRSKPRFPEPSSVPQMDRNQ